MEQGHIDHNTEDIMNIGRDMIGTFRGGNNSLKFVNCGCIELNT